MRIVTDFPHKVTEHPDIGIVMPDGCRLSTRAWLPADPKAEPVPAILEFLPYRKRDGTTVRDALTHPWFAGHGYACLRVDMRGSGDSDGLLEDEYTAQELQDACDVIAWAAKQPWCNGSVGMMGISWGGFNGLQVAALDPPALKAVVTLCSTADRYADDIHYKGGCLLNENLGWGATMWSCSSLAPDPALRDDWREVWLERLKAEPFLPSIWLRHQTRDAYWQHGSICEDYSAIKAAVLAVGGWGDAYKNTVPMLVENLSAPVKGIVGPWVHKYPHFAVPEPRIGFLQEAKRWWDKWLKGIETGVEDDPAYRPYLMDGARPASWYDHRPGRWLATDSWPSPRARTETLPLLPGTLGAKSQGTAESFEQTLASPQHCGMNGGEFCAIWLGPEMPGDQRADDALSVCYDTSAMTQTDIVGAPVLRLTLRSDQPVAQLAVRLNHVHPDGASTRITWGVLNLTHLQGHNQVTPLQPGQDYHASIPLDHIAYRLPEGHRLRISISSAYWPMIWPSPQATCLTLTGGALELPVLDGAGDSEWVFPPAEAATPLELQEIRPESHVRRSEQDHQTGNIKLIIEDDFGLYKNSEHGLANGSIAREIWEIHPDDPLSAQGNLHWTEEIQRDQISLRTETFSEMWSDETHFHLRARLEAWEGDALIYERDLQDQILRNGL